MKRPSPPYYINPGSPQANGLKFWWPMGQTSEYRNYALGSHVTSASNDTALAVDPEFGRVAEFVRASSQDIDFGDVFEAEQAQLGDAWSISAWVKCNAGDDGNYHGVIGKERQFVFYKSGVGGGPWSFWVADGASGWNYANGPSAVAGEWAHIVGTKEPGATADQKVYYQGRLRDTDSETWTAPGADTNTLAIGSKSGSFPFDGQIADVRIYTKTLNANEVRTLYDPRTRWDLYWQPRSRTYFAPAATTVDYTLTAALGSYNLTGVAAGLTTQVLLSTESGSYNITGPTIGHSWARTITASLGTYNITGIASGLQKNVTLTAALGSYNITGPATGLTKNTTITASLGSYNLTGIAAGSTVQVLLGANVGSYNITGPSIGSTIQVKLAADEGSYNITGIDNIMFESGSVAIGAEQGTYNITGGDANLTVTLGEVSTAALQRGDMSISLGMKL